METDGTHSSTALTLCQNNSRSPVDHSNVVFDAEVRPADKNVSAQTIKNGVQYRAAGKEGKENHEAQKQAQQTEVYQAADLKCNSSLTRLFK